MSIKTDSELLETLKKVQEYVKHVKEMQESKPSSEANFQKEFITVQFYNEISRFMRFYYKKEDTKT